MDRKKAAGILVYLVALGLALGLFRRPGRKVTVTRVGESRPRTPGPARLAGAAGMVEPLNLRTLVKRIDNVFHEGYLAILGITQGVALGLLVSTAQDQWHQHPGTIPHITIATQSVGVFTAILVTTHRYMLLTVIGRWIPSTFDTLVPYALGLGEISAALNIAKNAAWWASMAVFSLSGAGSFIYSRIRSSVENYNEVPQVYARFRQITNRGIAVLSLLAAASIAITVLSDRHIFSAWDYALLPLLSGTVILSFEVFGNYRISAVGEGTGTVFTIDGGVTLTGRDQ